MASEVANAFVQHFYNTFDSNRANLVGLFCDVSQLSFEGAAVTGAPQIMQKLTGLPFKKVKHVVTTIDSQETIDNGIIVFVVGQLQTDDDPPHGFSEVFHLKKAGESFMVLNNAFRLSLHN